MVQLAMTDEGMRVFAADRAPIKWDSANEDGPQATIVSAIRLLLARGRFKGRDVISALPPDRLKITSLRLAEGEMLSTERTLRKEAAHRFGLDPRIDAINYILAGTVRQGDELKNEYILFATDDKTIKSHIALLEEAGLTPRGIDAGPCALFRNFERTMRRQEDRERTIIFIDVGHRHTIVVFGRADEICFVKQMAFGAARFAEDIAAKLDISTNEAESLRIKMRNGESVDATTRRLVVDSLHATAEQLAAEISLCLRYYTVTFRGKRVERAVMAGGGAHEATLLDVMRHHLAIETDVATPLQGPDLGSHELGEDLDDLSPDYAMAVGLSLKGSGPFPEAPDRNGHPESIMEGAAS
jgi:type IV pilus assembly protein PilM